MILRTWKPIRKGSLIGVAGIALPNGLEIDDVLVLITPMERSGRRFRGVPSSPVMAESPGSPAAVKINT
jgi:hypothetical protein